MSSPSSPPRTYLDWAATCPVRPEVAQQVTEDLTTAVAGRGNPASQHSSGRHAAALLAEARARLAAALDVDPHEVLFTSGGTEADALVVSGRARAVPGGRLVISPTEHPAVLDSARAAVNHLGAELILLEVDQAGSVVPTSLDAAVHHDSAGAPASLVSVMTVNNETGLVQDVPALVERVREASGARRPGQAGYVPVHSDVVAALGKVAVEPRAWDLDAMSLAGHKLGAPAGTGALVARREVVLAPVTGGGRQERAVRSGTQDVIGARALALAVELAVAERQKQASRLEELRERVLRGASALGGAHATLPTDAASSPATAHLWFEDCDAEALLMGLDLAGVDVSAGSACHAGVSQPSHVLVAMGLGEQAARSTLRVSMGPTTTGHDVDHLLEVLPTALERARRAWAARSCVDTPREQRW
ncbi:cysteine desulfurase [Actinomyces lilanjuaniae]|uniref:cysteine desulfurase n=1 Tax=Actinomyces lilanjuaniae TaxID=2321394 RepID=A0ABN5PP23_9ACTO|nr:cysteine desulfurase family protein [Actinomyces lilanjuaniae]AYD90150.1 cysteine desulfurase [Actinomyces lilanjuaniae]